MADALDFGGAVGGEAGDDQGGGGADVGGGDLRAVQFGGAGDLEGVPDLVDGDPRAEPAEAVGVGDAVFEDALLDAGFAGGAGEERGHRRLQVGREAGIGDGLDVGLAERAGGADADAAGSGEVAGIRFERDAHLGELGAERREVGGDGVLNRDVAAGDGGGDGEGAGFDAVGDQGVAGAVQVLDAFDDDGLGAGAGDLRAHGVEQAGEVGDFGFGGGVDDLGAAFGEDGGHDDVFGAGDGGIVEQDRRGAEAAGGAGAEVLRVVFGFGGGFGFGAEAVEAVGVDVELALADPVAAGAAMGVAMAGQQRADDEGGGAQAQGQLVGHAAAVDGLSADPEGAGDAVPLDLGTERAEDSGQILDVGDVGDALEEHRLIGQQRRGHAGQGGVLRARDGDGTAQRAAADDAVDGFGHRAAHCTGRAGGRC